MQCQNDTAHNVNCIDGCSHDCRYCYARAAAVRVKRRTVADWHEMRPRAHEIDKRRRKLDGRVMFPTTHDITPETFGSCAKVLGELLRAGNEVLVVTKPHFECVRALCDLYRLNHVDRLTWRFTIGATCDHALKFWEPGAPPFAERLRSLAYAHFAGFRCGVSAEPMLEPWRIDALVDAVRPFVTDTIWLGLMNKMNQRVLSDGPDSVEMIQCLSVWQRNDANIQDLYDQYKADPMIRWKESIKRIVGLPLATTAGEDE